MIITLLTGVHGIRSTGTIITGIIPTITHTITDITGIGIITAIIIGMILTIPIIIVIRLTFIPE